MSSPADPTGHRLLAPFAERGGEIAYELDQLEQLEGKPRGLTRAQCRMLVREAATTRPEHFPQLAARYGYKDPYYLRKLLDAPYLAALTRDVELDFQRSLTIAMRRMAGASCLAVDTIESSLREGDIDTAKFVMQWNARVLMPRPEQSVHHHHDHAHSGEVQSKLTVAFEEVAAQLAAAREAGTIDITPEQFIRRGTDGITDHLPEPEPIAPGDDADGTVSRIAHSPLESFVPPAQRPPDTLERNAPTAADAESPPYPVQ